MWSANFSVEAWYLESETERERFQALLHRSIEMADRVLVSCRELGDARAATRALVALCQTERAARQDRSAGKDPTPDVLDEVLSAAGMCEDDLPEFADDLIAAYRRAMAVDDAEVVARLRKALILVGTRLASKLGPKKSGFLLN